MSRKLSKLKEQVEIILRDCVDSRNSDVTLMIRLWERFYSHYILENKATGAKGINIKSLYELPREDHIKRYRAHFQNDKSMYLPTSLEVVKQRRINQEVWRDKMRDLNIPTRL